ncbi:MAG TPA: helix-turn-helix domain-containing protein, partial [Candidatus Saccharimonadales bacterium]|nr:helix-turn-helix domain-containing protein [Candidatus Saccharimonadales bacterium]
KPLEEAVAKKEFREDLFYRLNVVRVAIPPLRDRPGDIRLLVNYFLKKFARTQNQRPKSISNEALQALEQYAWPGNVRELENIVQRALVLAQGDAIMASNLPQELFASSKANSAIAAPRVSLSGTEGGAPSTEQNDLPSLARALFQWARKESKLKLIPAVERELIIHALVETHGNQVQAAKLLGITRATLRKRVDKFQIKQELAIK